MDAHGSSSRISRRNFLGASASVAASSWLGHGFSSSENLVRGHTVAAQQPIRLAAIGVGAQGTRVMMDFLKFPDVRVVAVCDVNRESGNYSEWWKGEILAKERALLQEPHWGSDWAGPTCGREPARRLVEAYYRRVRKLTDYKSCAAYNDFRELFERERDLDGVVVCTPDHWHAYIAIYALRRGKHVFSQKPMAHTVHECALMAQAARATGLATQVAVMDEASNSTRHLTEWVAAGVIGQVREVHNWSQRPYWPQGLPTPAQADPIPDGFDWDLWLGPAPARPFNQIYLPFVWRGWYDFGEGSIGDMGNYSFDTLFRVLDLTAPTRVEASSTPRFPDSWPLATTMHWHFPQRPGTGALATRAPVDIFWYDAHLRPPRPRQLLMGENMDDSAGEGMLLVGEKGKILCGFMGGNPRLLPTSRMRSFTPPPDTLDHSPGAYQEWLRAIRGGPMPRANYVYEQAVVEAILLGAIAVRASDQLVWDAATKRITALASGKADALAAANGWLNPPRRRPWGFETLV